MGTLEPKQQEALTAAQQKWLAFRDTPVDMHEPSGQEPRSEVEL